jgi:hypothetical protein
MIRCAEGARCAQRAWRISLHLIRFSPFNLITKLITSCGAGVRPSLEGLPYVKWLGRMDLGAVRSSWDEYRDQRRRSKRTNSMRTRGELGKANADVSTSRKL